MFFSIFTTLLPVLCRLFQPWSRRSRQGNRGWPTRWNSSSLPCLWRAEGECCQSKEGERRDRWTYLKGHYLPLIVGNFNHGLDLGPLYIYSRTNTTALVCDSFPLPSRWDWHRGSPTGNNNVIHKGHWVCWFRFPQRILSRFGRKLHVMWVFTCGGVHESVCHIEEDSCKTVKTNGETDLASQPPSEREMEEKCKKEKTKVKGRSLVGQCAFRLLRFYFCTL